MFEEDDENGGIGTPELVAQGRVVLNGEVVRTLEPGQNPVSIVGELPEGAVVVLSTSDEHALEIASQDITRDLEQTKGSVYTKPVEKCYLVALVQDEQGIHLDTRLSDSISDEWLQENEDSFVTVYDYGERGAMKQAVEIMNKQDLDEYVQSSFSAEPDLLVLDFEGNEPVLSTRVPTEREIVDAECRMSEQQSEITRSVDDSFFPSM